MPSTHWRNEVVRRARRIVVKVGTSALTDDRGQLDVQVVADLAAQLATVMRDGLDVTLVSSGAVGAGMGELGLTRRPKTLPLLQATAAVGQGQLMRQFHDAFVPFDVKVAQILVTRGDFENRARYLNIRNTIAALQDLGAVPIINENDSVAVDELRFGDNDMIAAHVTNMVQAEVLVLLTVVDGVLSGSQVLDVIEDARADAARLPTGAISRLGSGGMGSKLHAAHMVTAAGEVAIIANARTPNVLGRLLAGEKLGTLCTPGPNKLSARRRWIGQASRAAGRIVIDAGAVEALRRKGRSLLPTGITAVSGSFTKGDTVAIVDGRGKIVARGLSNYDVDQVDRIKGLKTGQVARALGDKPYDEVVHRNNMMIL